MCEFVQPDKEINCTKIIYHFIFILKNIIVQATLHNKFHRWKD